MSKPKISAGKGWRLLRREVLDYSDQCRRMPEHPHFFKKTERWTRCGGAFKNTLPSDHCCLIFRRRIKSKAKVKKITVWVNVYNVQCGGSQIPVAGFTSKKEADKDRLIYWSHVPCFGNRPWPLTISVPVKEGKK